MSDAQVEYAFMFRGVLGVMVKESKRTSALLPDMIVGAGFVLLYAPTESTRLNELAEVVPTFVTTTLGRILNELPPFTE
jgi:hypothetical protein